MAYIMTITDLLNQWADFGVFAYVLPFLIVFAIVYGILDKTGLLGKNKGVNAAIALAFGLLSLQFDYVPMFFSSLFPYAGMGVAVLLIALILMGLVGGDKEKQWHYYVWFGIGIVIFIVVILTSLSDMSWFGSRGYAWQEAWPSILAGIIIIGLIAFIIWGDRRGSSSSSS